MAKTTKRKPKSKDWKIYIPKKERASQIKSRRDHWHSTWNSDKRNELIQLIKRDVTQKDACAFVGLPVSTLHDWLKRDKNLSEEYDRAEKWMDITTSNVLSSGLNDKELQMDIRMKYAMEWKKRRDKRYSDKTENKTYIVELDPEDEAKVDELMEMND